MDPAHKVSARDRRADARLLMDEIMGDMSASLGDGDGSLGRILDLSASGLQFATNATLRPGARRQLRCPALDQLADGAPIWAEVIWCQMGRAGLRFVDAVTGATMFRQIFRRWCSRAQPETVLMWIDAI